MPTVTGKGIDVSSWQGNYINWEEVKKAGYSFAIIRAGFGRECSQKDASFEVNYAGAKKAGLLVGAYWYSYAVSPEDAKKEAEACLATLSGKTFDLPIFYDIEEASILSKSSKDVTAIAKNFCETIEKGGYRAGIYGGFDLFRKIDDAVEDKYPRWFAQWYTECQYEKPVAIWQYTESLTVPGISGNVDGNVSYIDFKTPSKPATLVIPSPDVKKYSIIELAFRTMNGEYSSGDTRKALLGDKYQKVQDCVNLLAADAGMFLIAKKLNEGGFLK